LTWCALSFALLVCASAWCKCHAPAAFLCALLNSQPMGVFTPSQLVQHAARTQPGCAGAAGPVADPRLGRRRGCARIELARAVRPFAHVADLAQRAQLTRRDLQALASANALASLAGNRRAALWHALAAVPDRDLLRAAVADDATPAFAPLTQGQAIAHDYRALGLTLGRHPLALPRAQLLQRRLLPAAAL
jgi:error-prone DNA polymerase